MASTLVTDTDTTVDFLRLLFEQLPLEHLAVRLWDGTHWPDAAPRAATIVLNHPGALREMFAEGTAKGLAEAYVRGEFDIVGDIEAAIDLATALETKPLGWLGSLEVFLRLRRLPGKSESRSDGRLIPGLRGAKHTLRRDREAVSFHYDVSNEFYRLWLDERMVYSCGYFETPDQTIHQAQKAKLDHICRKLRLWPGQHLLDIGCGWGGLAIFAAKHYHVRVTGVTLSEQQARWASERVSEEGLGGCVEIELRDYRELQSVDGYDAIASVGMAEHVGRENLPEYFAAAWKLLRDGGVFLNHAIGEGRKPQRFRGPSFVDEYVFPDSDIPPLPLVVQAAAGAGFEIRDVENLREHYALTLRQWVRRLEAAHEQALAHVNEPTYRVWRLYMAGSAHGFQCGDLAIYQTLLSKPTLSGSAHLPLTRKDWYA
jgi:cyclopropane-fatty-acyl-phospholipid synthase